MANQVNLDNVSVQFHVRPVLRDVSVGIDDRDRIGVVGLNGAGKSSLLDVVTRRRTPDLGRVSWRSGLQVAVVGQTDDFDDTATIRDVVVPGSLGTEHDWAADPRVRRVVEGLGLLNLGLERSVDSLSGGERRRVGLAAALVSDVDLLVLDEPTNHLDIEGVQWLAEYLRGFSGALLVVTHDRWFLDTVCTRTWEVVGGGVNAYEGGYADWIFARAERDRIADSTEERRRNLARKELAWLRRGAPARTSKPRFRIEAANALIADVPQPRNPTQLVATAVSRMGKSAVDLDVASVQFGAREVLRAVTWHLTPGARYGVLGPNGAGKSTLLRAITGDQPLTSGRRTAGTTVRIAHLSQNLAELDPAARMIEAVSAEATLIRIGDKDLTVGQLLERFGFPSAMHKQLVRDLSGGQRRRLQMVRTLMREPNLLILDEPTNDLDVNTLAALEDLLDEWPGTLVVVSHDRYLLERVTDDQYAVLGDGTLRHLPRGVEQYLQLRREQPTVPAGRTAVDAAGGPAAGTVISGADLRAAQKELGGIERRLGKVTSSISAVHQRMADHDQSDFEGLQRHTDKLRELEAEVAELEDRWLALSDFE